MVEDCDQTAHPISFDVKNSADIRRIFDPISYSKGASIIRMMQSYLGEQAFWGALKKYLDEFQYSNAVHDDLWNVMTEFGHNMKTLPDDLTVKTIMDSWTLHAGYPILSVKLDGTSIRLTQQHYLLPTVNKSDTQTWHIPITYVIFDNQTRTSGAVKHDWLHNGSELELKDVIKPGDWYYFNIQRTGYYRVNYDYKSWLAFITNYDYLPNTTIAQLIDDALNLARAEVITYDIPLTFLLKLRAEDKLAWSAATSGIEYITNMLNREPAYEHFRVSFISLSLSLFSLSDKKNDK